VSVRNASRRTEWEGCARDARPRRDQKYRIVTALAGPSLPGEGVMHRGRAGDAPLRVLDGAHCLSGRIPMVVVLPETTETGEPRASAFCHSRGWASRWCARGGPAPIAVGRRCCCRSWTASCSAWPSSKPYSARIDLYSTIPRRRGFEPGVNNSRAVTQAVRARGLLLRAPDPSSPESPATIGGNLAENYGVRRALASNTAMTTNNVPARAASLVADYGAKIVRIRRQASSMPGGYDLPSAIVHGDSEGLLGVVTEITLCCLLKKPEMRGRQPCWWASGSFGRRRANASARSSAPASSPGGMR